MASIWRHPKSKYWSACYTDKTGKQVKRSTKLTDKRLAQSLAIEWELLEQKARQRTITATQIQRVIKEMVDKTTEDTAQTRPVDEYLKEWIANMSGQSEATMERYKHTVDLFIKSLGKEKDTPLNMISAGHIEAFMNKRIKSGLAPKTVSVDIKTLSAAFNRAERFGFILKNPVPAVQLPKIVSSHRNMFTVDQVTKLLHTVKYTDEWFTMILLGFYTGARLKDCAMMKWEGVNFKERSISYVQQKTGKRVDVPLVDDLYEHLNFLFEFKRTDYINEDIAKGCLDGKPALSMQFNRIVKKAGIDPETIQGKGKQNFNRLTFHSLRHSFNSILANQGVSPEIRIKLTGHASIGMNQVYTHHDKKPLEDAVNKMPLIFGDQQ